MKNQKEEAIRRMQKLHLSSEVIKDFEKNGAVPVSVAYQCDYLVDSLPSEVKRVQSDYDVLVYYVMIHNAPFGHCLSMLFVSKYDEEWEMDNADLDAGYAFAWVSNMDDPIGSEFGSIGIKVTGDIITRVQ